MHAITELRTNTANTNCFCTVVCRLTQLPALPWLPHLEALHLQDNELTSLAPLHGLPCLRQLNLSFNRLERLRGLSALLPLTALRSLQLNDNPVANMAGYRECAQVQLADLSLHDTFTSAFDGHESRHRRSSSSGSSWRPALPPVQAVQAGILGSRH